MAALVCNAGSSSLKFSLFQAEREVLLAEGGIDWSAEPAKLMLRRSGRPDLRQQIVLRDHAGAMARILDDLRADTAILPRGLGQIRAVGHRVVHGGEKYTSAVLITADVQREIAKLAELAPLHNAAALEVIRAVEQALPRVPQVAAFDTAFHSTLSPASFTYPVPRKWTRDWGVRRFGFHGLSHSYCAARVAEMLARKDLNLVVAHLGNGASISAIRAGVCIDTSMGFTPLEGLMMGTRSGSVDPGLLLYLLRHKKMDAEHLDHALNFESGLLGVSGVSSDMRQVLAAAADNPDAKLAIEIYVHRIRKTIGAMTATLGGLDALVFTAGVGENAATIRASVCDNLAHLGVQLASKPGEHVGPDYDIAAPDSRVRVLVIAAREDLSIVREVRTLIRATGAGEQP